MEFPKLKIHTLTSSHATLSEHDASGFGKRLMFGNTLRGYIASQYDMQYLRERLQENSELPTSYQSRLCFSKIILPKLRDRGLHENHAVLAIRAFMKLINLHNLESTEPTDHDSFLQMRHHMLLGADELNYVERLIAGIAKQIPAEYLEVLKAQQQKRKKSSTFKIKKVVEITAELYALDPEFDDDDNMFFEAHPEVFDEWIFAHSSDDVQTLESMLRNSGHEIVSAGLAGAVFGRLTGSNIFSSVSAAVQLAHAFTVHRVQAEIDFIHPVDDLQADGNSVPVEVELTSGLYYRFQVVDIPQLVSNLTGCDVFDWHKSLTEEVTFVLRRLIELIADGIPGRSNGSTAVSASTDFLMLEISDSLPTSYANAFLTAIESEDLMQSAVDRIAERIRKVSEMHGERNVFRSVATTAEWPLDEARGVEIVINEVLSLLFDDK